MPAAIVGGFLVIHGLITTMIGVGAVTSPNSPAMTLPSWFNWWPGPFGRSWLFEALGLGSGGAVAGGLLWLVSGVLLLGAGLGFLGLAPLRDQWPLLGLIGGGLGLVTLTLYFHPLYLVAVAINLVLVVLAWGRLTTAG